MLVWVERRMHSWMFVVDSRVPILEAEGLCDLMQKYSQRGSSCCASSCSVNLRAPLLVRLEMSSRKGLCAPFLLDCSALSLFSGS